MISSLPQSLCNALLNESATINADEYTKYHELVHLLASRSRIEISSLWKKSYRGVNLIEWFLIQTINLTNQANKNNLAQLIICFLQFEDNNSKFANLLLVYEYEKKNLIKWILFETLQEFSINPFSLLHVVENILQCSTLKVRKELLFINQNNKNLALWYLNNTASTDKDNISEKFFLSAIELVLTSRSSPTITELSKIKRDNKTLIPWYLCRYYEQIPILGEEPLKNAIVVVARTRRKIAYTYLLKKIPNTNQCWIDWLLGFIKNKNNDSSSISLSLFTSSGDILSYLNDLSIEVSVDELVLNRLSELSTSTIKISYLMFMIIKEPQKLTRFLIPSLSIFLQQSLICQLIEACEHPQLRTILSGYIQKIIKNKSFEVNRFQLLETLKSRALSTKDNFDLDRFLSELFRDEDHNPQAHELLSPIVEQYQTFNKNNEIAELFNATIDIANEQKNINSTENDYLTNLLTPQPINYLNGEICPYSLNKDKYVAPLEFANEISFDPAVTLSNQNTISVDLAATNRLLTSFTDAEFEDTFNILNDPINNDYMPSNSENNNVVSLN